MQKKYKIALTILGVLIIGISYIGLTYSFWVKTFESNETNTIKSGCFTISFEELSSSISLRNTYPVSDLAALSKVKPYEFKISNTCDTTDAGYAITLNTVNVSGAKLADNKVKVALGVDGIKPSSGSLLSEKEINTELENITPNLSGTLDTSYIIKTGFIDKGASKTFALYLWMDESATTEEANKLFEAGVIVTSYSVKKGPTAVDTIKNIPIVTSGDGLYEVSHNDVYTCYSDADGAPFNVTELRYAGKNPNNYVQFNDELWRMIGLVNIYYGQRIKLVRAESIGSYSWDSSDGSTNVGRGVNEWSQADAMKLLNPGYESESIGGSLYWNRRSGTCYNGETNATTPCDFTSIGLNEESKNMIESISWNTGTRAKTELVSEHGLADDYYIYERSCNNGKSGGSGNTALDTDLLERTTDWTGHVGLMYPSDYGYATIGGSTTNRQSCLANNLVNWNSYADCMNNNWLYTSSSWLMTPNYDNSEFNPSWAYAFHITDGHIGTYSFQTSDANAIYPTIYLKSDVYVMDGDGSQSNPFILNY